MHTMEITYYTAEGEEVTTELPCRRVVCPKCEGIGSHLNPSIGEHAYSAEEFFEAFPEEEDREAYFHRGGMYDVTCEQCKGENVIEVVDEKRCTTPEQKAHLTAYKAHLKEQGEFEAECRAEQRRESMMLGEEY